MRRGARLGGGAAAWLVLVLVFSTSGRGSCDASSGVVTQPGALPVSEADAMAKLARGEKVRMVVAVRVTNADVAAASSVTGGTGGGGSGGSGGGGAAATDGSTGAGSVDTNAGSSTTTTNSSSTVAPDSGSGTTNSSSTASPDSGSGTTNSSSTVAPDSGSGTTSSSSTAAPDSGSDGGNSTAVSSDAAANTTDAAANTTDAFGRRGGSGLRRRLRDVGGGEGGGSSSGGGDNSGHDARALAASLVKQRLFPGLSTLSAASASEVASGSTGRRAAPVAAPMMAAAASVDGGAGVGSPQLVTDFSELPAMVVEFDSLQALEAFRASPDVLSVEFDHVLRSSVTESLSQIYQPDAVSQFGAQGTGCTIVVIDKGADYRVPDLGSCTSVNSGGSCKVVYMEDIAPNDGLLDAVDGHGTNVASIAARTAPGAKIVALDAFLSDGSTTVQLLLSGINWAILNQAATADRGPVCAINLSVGDGVSYSSSTTCFPTNALSIAIGTARAAGIGSAVAAGNEAFTSGVAWPACVEASIAVGAVYDSDLGQKAFSVCTDAATWADKTSCFSNAGYGLDILAPGSEITAGGFTKSGTSMAAPHVAGAIAVLKAAAPSATVDAIETALKSSGNLVPDPRTGLAWRRMNLAAAVASLTGQTLSDSVAPTAKIVLAGGAEWTSTRTVSADFYATDLSGVATSCSSEQGEACTTFSTFTANPTSFSITSAGDGVKTVVLAMRDAKGNTGTSTGTIKLDTTAPTGSVAIALASGFTATSSRFVTVTLTGADAQGGALTYCVGSFGTDCGPLTLSTSAWGPLASPLTRSFTLDAGEGTKAVFLNLRDPAGNIGQYSSSVVFDVTPPTSATVVANSGAAATANALVSLAITGTDGGTVPSGIAAMCISQTSTCTDFVPYAASTSFMLSGGDGAKTIFVYLRDGAGNRMTTAATTTIALRTTPPSAQIAINGGAAYTNTASVGVTVIGVGAGDVATICISTTNFGSSSCTPYVAYSGAAIPLTLPAGEGSKTVYASLRDAVGNTIPAPATATIVLDSTPPTSPSVIINDGSGTSRRAVVALTISGTDTLSGIGKVCASNINVSASPASCSPFVAFSSPLSWTLAPGLGNRTVWVVLQDGAGNTGTTAASATVDVRSTSAPSATVVINGGAAWATTASTAVSITTDGDVSAVRTMCLGPAGATCSPFVPFVRSTTYTFTGGSGAKEVYLWLRDVAGDVLDTPAKGKISFDATPPTATVSFQDPDAATKAAKSGVVDLLIQGKDDFSGVDSMCLYDSAGASNTTTVPCTKWVPFATSAQLQLAAAEGDRQVGVLLRDKAGNVMASPVTQSLSVDFQAPTNTRIMINGGRSAVRRRTVRLKLNATDASGVKGVCITQDPAVTADRCKPWRTMRSVRGVTLKPGNGEKTIRVFWKDGAGHITPNATEMTVTIDSTPPTMPSDGSLALVAAPRKVSVRVAWNPSSTEDNDGGSGLAGYILVWRQGLSRGVGYPSAGCGPNSGDRGSRAEIKAGAKSYQAFAGIQPGMWTTFRLCAVDAAGNTSPGRTTATKTLG